MEKVISGSLTLRFTPCHEEIGKPGFPSSTGPWGGTFLPKRYLRAQLPLFLTPDSSKEPWVQGQALGTPLSSYCILGTHRASSGSPQPQTHPRSHVFMMRLYRSSPFVPDSTNSPICRTALSSSSHALISNAAQSLASDSASHPRTLDFSLDFGPAPCPSCCDHWILLLQPLKLPLGCPPKPDT